MKKRSVASPDNEITHDELLAELERLGSVCTEDGLTARELSKLWGCGIAKVRDLLRKASSVGRLRIHTKTVYGIDGRGRAAPSYKILPK